jgi:8-oxo-dGTP pyrophosphatase MutT (NUDIX family)
MPQVTSPDPAATVMLLRPNTAGFEVLMVERSSRGFFGSIVVFPGGSVDASDQLEDDDEGSARRAAIRELAEEVGILLIEGGAVSSPPLRGRQFHDWLGDEGHGPAVDSLVLVSRWVTPEPAPRRFDTRFYLAGAASTPAVRLDTNELVGHRWVTPADALALHESGEWPMILPTLAHLRWLARRSSIEDALQSARGADGRTLIQPRRMEDGSLLPIHLPAEAI